MKHLRRTLIVAAWEFRRYFKWKDQIISLIFFIAIGLVWWGVAKMLQSGGRTMTVAVAGVALDTTSSGRLEFVPAPADDTARTRALRDGEVNGVLTARGDATFELLVAKEPQYRGELTAFLTEMIQRQRLEASGLTAEDLAALLSPAPLDVRFIDPDQSERGAGEKIAAGVFIAVMLLAVFTSMAYLFTGITGEKQLRVTESVVSAISPQAWIDGKVLGVTGYGLAGVVNLAVGGVIVATGARMATGFTLPSAVIRPGIVVTLLVFAILGMFFWNAFFAAIAATIDDPNTSTRSSMLLLPVLPVVMALAVIRDPDWIVSRVLAVFPLTSAPAMPVRLVLSDPGPLEVLLSATLLVAAIWLVRRIAGRVFEVGILLYGKEPTWSEITRWALYRGK